MTASNVEIRRVETADLSEAETAAIRALMRAAFEGHGEGFTDEDWQHATGGLHFLLEDAGAILVHASVVERELHAGDRAVRAGYVEAVATRTDVQGRGLGSRVMREVNAHIRERYELGALSAAAPEFYRMLGWQPWLGPTAVRTVEGPVPTPEDDGDILILVTPSTPTLDRHGPLTCEWRSGDVW
jgi:aminoglycoside 2'-N-acetyltransferase I